MLLQFEKDELLLISPESSVCHDDVPSTTQSTTAIAYYAICAQRFNEAEQSYGLSCKDRLRPVRCGGHYTSHLYCLCVHTLSTWTISIIPVSLKGEVCATLVIIFLKLIIKMLFMVIYITCQFFLYFIVNCISNVFVNSDVLHCFPLRKKEKKRKNLQCPKHTWSSQNWQKTFLGVWSWKELA